VRNMVTGVEVGRKQYLVKVVRGNTYFRLDQLSNPSITLSSAQKRLVNKYFRFAKGYDWSLCRIGNDLSSISFMEYDWDFKNPCLVRSVKVTIKPEFKVGKVRCYTKNPPVLHLCYLYFPVGSKEREFYKNNRSW
jgi:hypothetical protein